MNVGDMGYDSPAISVLNINTYSQCVVGASVLKTLDGKMLRIEQGRCAPHKTPQAWGSMVVDIRHARAMRDWLDRIVEEHDL